MVQIQGQAKKGKKGQKPKKQVKPPPPPAKEESSEEEEESESEEEPAQVKGKAKAQKVVAKKQESDEESEEESDEEEEEPKGANGKVKNATKKEESEDDDDEEEDDDEEDSDDEEEGKAAVKKNQEEEEDSDDDDEDDDDDDEKEKKATVKSGKQEKMEVDDDDDDDDEEDSDEEEEEEKPKKRKIEQNTEAQEAKKAKNEQSGELVTMMFTGLPDGTTDQTFNKFLNSKGIQCKSCRANYGRNKAFVDIDTSDKGKAIALHQVEWKGYELCVEEAKPRNQGRDASETSDRDARTMFVRNLPYSASEDDLKGIFDNVEEVRLLTDRDTGRAKGLAFVQFNDAAALDKAMESKDELELEGRQLMVDYTDSRSQKRGGGGGGGGRRGGGGFGGRDRGRGGRFSGGGESSASSTLFVKGVTEDMSKEEFSKYFENASDVRMITDKDTGKNKFFAYVEFESEDRAKECYTASKGGIEAEDGSTTFYVDYARDKRRSDGGGRGGGGFGGRGRGGFRGRGGGGGGFRGRGGGRGRGFRGGGRGGFGGGGGKRTTFGDDSD